MSVRAATLPRGVPGEAGRGVVAAEGPRRRRWGGWLVALMVLAGLLGGAYLFWFRDSELVRVERTTVTGLSTADAGEIRRSLVEAAGRMTTLNLDEPLLERSVERFPEVAGLEIEAAFPHELTVHVTERRPVATVPGPGGAQVAVAADGTLLPDAEPGRPLASLPGPGASGAGRLDHGRTLAALEVAAAAPPALVGKVATVRQGPSEGLVVELRDGPPLVFGDRERLEAKWTAATSVLARGAAAGARYVDVSLPDRPAVGG